MKGDRLDPEGIPDDYISFGWFDPLVCKRIIKQLIGEHIRFAARDASGVGMTGFELLKWFSASNIVYPILHRASGIELLVHTADAEKARSVIDAT